jgi:hypothetical protein
MIDFLKELLSFFVDNKRHYSAKVATFFVIICCVYLANDITGFNYYYNLNHRIEGITSINEILKDSTVVGKDKEQLIALRGEILSHKNTIDGFADKIKNSYRSLKYRGVLTHSADNKVIINESVAIKYASRNDFAFLITSSGLYVFLMILIIPIGVYALLKADNLSNTLIGIIAVEVMIGIPVVLSYYIFGLIPLIKNNWTWNYVLNFVLQIIFLSIISIAITTASKKK